MKIEVSDEDTEMVELLGPLTANPNDPNNSGTTPIYHAAFFWTYQNCPDLV